MTWREVARGGDRVGCKWWRRKSHQMCIDYPLVPGPRNTPAFRNGPTILYLYLLNPKCSGNRRDIFLFFFFILISLFIFGNFVADSSGGKTKLRLQTLSFFFFNLMFNCRNNHVSIGWLCMCAKSLQLSLTLCNPVDHSVPDSSLGFSRQEYWSGLPFLSPGDLPDSGTEPMSLMSPALAGRFFTTSTTWEDGYVPIFGGILSKINYVP